jgi:hypothetical protein
MALNFGLGFGFRGNDLGLGKAVNGLSRDFRTLGKEMLGLQRLQTMLSALSFERLGDLGDKLKTLGTGGQELTSSIESTFTAFDKETRKLGATLGYTGKELTRFKKQSSSMAYGLNIGADEAGKAIYGFEATVGKMKAADILKDMGVDSAATLAKLGVVAGVSGDKFGYSLLQMGKKVNPKAVATITDMLTKFGQDAGDAALGLGKVDEITSILSTRKMLGDSPEQLAAFGKGIVATAQAFRTVTGNGEKAMETALGLATALTEGKKGFADLKAGAVAALHESTLGLAKAGPGIEAAFNAMSESPEVFLKKFATAVGGLSDGDAKAAVDLFRAHASSAFGASGDEIVKMLQTAEGRLALTTVDVGQMVADSAQATGKLAKEGFTTGITAAEAFERQQQGFLQRFRGLATVSTNQFLAESQASFNSFGAKMEKVAADGGPLGLVLGKLADIQKFGAKGLFPANLQGPLAALGTAAETLTAPLAKLRALGINLLSPFGALVGVFAGLGAELMSNYLTIEDQVGPTLDEMGVSAGERTSIIARMALEKTGKEIIVFMKNKLPGYLETGIKFISNFARKILSGGLFGDGAITGDKDTDAILNAVIFTLKEAFGKALAFAKEMFSGFMSGLMGEKIDPKAGDATVIGGAVGTMLHDALVFAFDETKKALSGMWAGLMGDPLAEDAGTSESLGHDLGKTLRAAFDFALGELKTYMADWWTRMGEIWDDPSMTFGEKVDAWFGESLPLLIAGAIIGLTVFGPIIAAFASLAGFLFKLAFTALWEHSLKQVFIQIATKMWGWFVGFGKFLLNGIGTVIRTLASVLWNVLTTVFRTIVAGISAAGLIVIAAFVAFFVGMFEMAKQEGDTFAQTWDRMWDDIGNTVVAYGEHILNFLSYIGQNTLTFFENVGAHISNFFTAGFDIVYNAFAVVFNFVREYTNKLATLISAPLTSIIQTIGDLLVGLGKTISESPGLAKFFGIDAATIANIKKAGEWLQSTKKNDVAAALSDPKMESRISTPRAIKAYRGLDADKIASISSREFSYDRDANNKVTPEELAQGRKDYAAFKAKNAKTAVPDLTPTGSGVLSGKAGNGTDTAEWVMLQSTNKENSAALVAAVENPKWAEEQRAEAAKQTAILATIAQILQENRNPTAAAGTRAKARSPASSVASTSPPAPLYSNSARRPPA